MAICWVVAFGARAQVYDTLANQPDPQDFVSRADTHLTLLGDAFRFGGMDVDWLGLRRDGDAAARRPTAYEVSDVLATVQALGGTVVRSRSLAATVGCPMCLEPSAGKFDPAAFAAIDLALKTARDLGIKLILPLAGAKQDCAALRADADGGLCAYIGWQGLTASAAFFTDASVKAAFLAHVHAILSHVNSLTGVAYSKDPTIFAWENCDGCGAGEDEADVAAWSEAVGQALKAEDPHHLYENGAFAGRILPSGPHVAPQSFATPSVDLVGDRLALNGDVEAARTALSKAAGAVVSAGRAYLLDDYLWAPAMWKSQQDLEDFLSVVARQRSLDGAMVGGLQGHADGGGWLPEQPTEGTAALYFPGRKTAAMDAATMQDRARALRRFNYDMADITLTPAYLQPPPPQIVSAEHGRLVWRGSAGSVNYTIERSPDPMALYSWEVVCDRCVSDDSGFWQDPHLPEGPAWYRVMPFNANGHKALPSEPFQDR